MAKNLIPEIAKMLGVELGEEFKVKRDDGYTYRFTSNELKLTYGNDIEMSTIATNNALVALLKGEDEIVKLPWKPKEGETYWGFNALLHGGKCAVISYVWKGKVFDNAMLKAGWIFRTQEEAEAALPKVAKEIGVNYILEGEAK